MEKRFNVLCWLRRVDRPFRRVFENWFPIPSPSPNDDDGGVLQRTWASAVDVSSRSRRRQEKAPLSSKMTSSFVTIPARTFIQGQDTSSSLLPGRRVSIRGTCLRHDSNLEVIPNVDVYFFPSVLHEFRLLPSFLHTFFTCLEATDSRLPDYLSFISLIALLSFSRIAIGE